MTIIEEIADRHKVAVDTVQVRSGALLETKAAEEPGQGGRMLITAVATTAAVDLDDEVVVPKGADWSYFKAFKSVYYNHRYDMPVAVLRNLAMTSDGSGWRIQVSTIGTEFSRDVAVCVAEGAINGGSIGFQRIDHSPPTPAEVSLYGPHEHITRTWKGLEWSITPMPCNPQAMIEGVTAGKSALREDTASRLSALVGKSRISRESARKMGLPDRKLIPVRGVIEVRRAS